MASRHPEFGSDHFDLLPFVAILLCVLGCLLLVTISMATLSLGPTATAGWLPVTDRLVGSKIPVLIEWDGTAALMHDGSRRIRAPWAKAGEVKTAEGRLIALPSEQERDGTMLEQVVEALAAQRDTHYALFAVRPSGFGSIDELADKFRARGIAVGLEPIAQGRPVRLLQNGAQP